MYDQHHPSQAVTVIGSSPLVREGLGLSLALETTPSEGAAALEIPPLALPREMTSLWIWPNGPFPGLRIDSTGSSTVVFETVEVSERLWRAAARG